MPHNQPQYRNDSFQNSSITLKKRIEMYKIEGWYSSYLENVKLVDRIDNVVEETISLLSCKPCIVYLE